MASAPQGIGAADPLTVTHCNLNSIRLKFCRTLELDIPVYDWTLIQCLCLTSLSGLGKRGGGGEGKGRTGLKSKSLISFCLKNESRE